MTPTYEELQQLLQLTEKELENAYRVLDVIPPCKVHGNRCIPSAIDWVEMRIEEEKQREKYYNKYKDGSKSN